MISTTIFSLVLMICLAGVLQITKMYYRSVTQNKTREVARTVVDEIAEAIRFTNQTIQIGVPQVAGPQVPSGSDDVAYFCIGQKRYTYAIDRQVKSNPSPIPEAKHKKHALWVDQLAGCGTSADLNADRPSSDGKDLLPENMRLYQLQISLINATTQTYQVSIGVAYGDNDLLSPRPSGTPTELTCEGSFVGTEFCATTKYLVTVQKRL